MINLFIASITDFQKHRAYSTKIHGAIFLETKTTTWMASLEMYLNKPHSISLMVWYNLG